MVIGSDSDAAMGKTPTRGGSSKDPGLGRTRLRRIATVATVALVAMVVPMAGIDGGAGAAPRDHDTDVVESGDAGPGGDASSSQAVMPSNTVAFTDVPLTAYYRDAVAWLLANGITTGVSQNPPLYGPSRNVTRAAMAAFLWRLMDEPALETSCGFNDVPTDRFFAPGACWLKAEGISTGVNNNTAVFAPDAVVTRAQMAAFLWRLAGEPPVQASTLAGCGLRDVPANSFFATAACWLKIKGITTGVGGNPAVFAPGSPVTRAQMAAFLDRLASTPEAFGATVPSAAQFDCEVLDPRSCLLPFPSDHFTVADDTTDTGLRIDFQRSSLPANRTGVRVNVIDQNRNDGFSPGSALLVHLPDVDLDASGAAPVTDLGSSLDPDSAVVIVNTVTGERHPHWVEVDARAPDPADKVTFIRPAVNFDEGVRYVVGLRNLVDSTGSPLSPSDAFAALRDGVSPLPASVEDRRDRMEVVFADLTTAGVDRSDLYLAWEFTVASQRSLSERVLHIRDEAFADLGTDAPAFTIAEGSDPSSGGVWESNGVRRVRGTFTVPNYLTGGGEPGTLFNLGPDGLPMRNATVPDLQVPFWCVIPLQASGDNPATMALSGHGLLQTGQDIVTGTSFDWAATGGNLTLCAADLWGLSGPDLGSVIDLLSDLSLFPTLADRGQQALLNFLYLGRLMKHVDGLSTHPAFQDDQDRSVMDRSQLYYNGNSQGGIMGGALMAVAQDFTRALLGVPGMNYSTLLERSALGEIFGVAVRSSYPDAMDRPIAMNVAQMLWDRSEANGYAHHVTSDPYPNTPAKEILMFVAWADEAVANVTSNVMARTMGIPVRQPALGTNRPTGNSPDVDPFWGIDPLTTFPHQGSAMLVWDFGNPPPPTSNTSPTSTPGYPDPHAAGARLSALRTLVFDYLSTDGVFNDVCNGQPCAGPRDIS